MYAINTQYQVLESTLVSNLKKPSSSEPISSSWVFLPYKIRLTTDSLSEEAEYNPRLNIGC